MAAASTNLISALGAGSGVDVKALAQGLVDAEKKPQEDKINKKIAQTEATISGYGALSFILGDLRSKFDSLNDLGDFNAFTTSFSQPAAVSVTANSQARAGNHSVQVQALASPQITASAGFEKSNSTLATGELTLKFTKPSDNSLITQFKVAPENATPEGIVFTINASNQGFSAELVNTGIGSNPYQIVITGQTGSANAFSLSGLDSDGNAVAGLSFVTELQPANDASLSINGLQLSRPSNSITDAIAGVTLNLTGKTTEAATLTVGRDTSAIKSKIKDLVTGYNDTLSVLKVTTDKDSKVEGYGASLVGDSTVQLVRSQVQSIFLGTSSTPGAKIKALRDVGITIQQDGSMKLDEAKLDGALLGHFDDTVKMFSNRRSSPTTLETVASGLAGDAVKRLDKLLVSNGTLQTQTANAKKRITDYQDQLARLNERMTRLLTRYNEQFGAMETLVGQTNSMRTSLQNSFDAMLGVKNND